MDGIPYNCHKRFRLKEQAERFIKEWCDLYCEIMRDVVAEQLRYGLRPLPIRGTLFGTTLLYLAGEEENSLTEIIDGLPGVRLDSDDINNGSRAT